MNKRSLIISIIIGFLTLLIPYSVAAFTIWDINPKNWSNAARWAVSAFGIILSVFGMIFTYDNTKNTN
ncbi:hypothetical protein J2O09_05635 [Elizabethkingia anophelis]|uniref:hypothetical protein n=1 Tax=Elizabethkingia anophelis TaxID=1117645 RepID=UPI0020B80985|nr:hypothetical protein [Elizabethkingia anophelis]UTG62437.1 hypothetical protein J2O09_05635 [Elizabethkingia anophelis]UXM68721.1 hypothetical protein N7E57_05650 [Elizabethkingia anophelis]